ncbi:MAG TPA: 2-amino-4-hydroxy-6-hydroxymethyldihydropteridine diphosphokinase [Spirochaetia bacterium]|nr:2-amino-4-hydroxy-6-hydroxymethyldihydropteridine diphosphokinase [Spirochaetia bacterium]HRZ63850.1 2-amino-4-hydroxy-6-hydroxymethyldihydropteridine diphosphokinase [Spirochaetia bacterium]
MAVVYLGLGSNLGDAERSLREAFRELGGILGGARLSRLWRSKARYVEDQPDFLNAVAAGDCALPPRELLAAVNRIEAAFGRDRSRERIKGPRPLDIDILLYGERLVAEPDLVIPHPGLRERKFALLPLLELAPGLLDPASGRSFASILASLPPQGIYLLGHGDYDRLYI